MGMKFDRKTLFAKPANPELAKKISIKSPEAFNKSINVLSKNGITTEEFRALSLAKVRADLQLRRKNLSAKERGEFTAIAKTKLPKVNV